MRERRRLLPVWGMDSITKIAYVVMMNPVQLFIKRNIISKLLFIEIMLFSFVIAEVPKGNSANGIRFEHLAMEQNGTYNIVQCIQQDARGYLWLGTVHGLARYDGNS